MPKINPTFSDTVTSTYTLEVRSSVPAAVALSFHLILSESKYQGAAVWPLIPGHDEADGTRRYPVAAIVANLAKPATTERPALITHADMVMLFHEIGHLFHELLSHTRFARFHGTTVALDFGEAPSQMLENWCVCSHSTLSYMSELRHMVTGRCYEPKVLARMSSHYETKKPLDSELIQKIIQRCVIFLHMSRCWITTSLSTVDTSTWDCFT